MLECGGRAGRWEGIGAVLLVMGCSAEPYYRHRDAEANDGIAVMTAGTGGSGPAGAGGTLPQGSGRAGSGGGTGSGGTGGSSAVMTGTGGSSAGTAGSGGSTGAAGTSGGGAGGSSTGTGTGGMGGTASGSGGASGGGTFSPLCSAVPLTAAGAAPTKGGECTASDPQLCYKTCGPQSIGFKSETCTASVYAEQSGCSFPAGADYSCYKIPAAIDASCPATAPQASQPCTVAECMPCNAGGNYLDSAGASKIGYCICPAGAAGALRKWSCASSTAWPCPAGQGC